MVARHEEKTSADRAAVAEKREELEAFKDIEMQEAPAADKLEQSSRLEIHRCGDELKKAIAEMNKVQREYESIRNEYEERSAANAQSENKKVDKRLLELRSMANVAETRLREAKAVTASRLEDMLDANSLLCKAAKEKEQQRVFFPLFKLLMIPDHYPLACDASQLLMACIVLSSGTFDEKFNFLMHIFGNDFSGTYNLDFILALGTVLATVLKVLHLIPATLSMYEIENLLLRTFSSFDLNPSKDALTDYEAKTIFRLMLCKSELLMKLFHITADPGHDFARTSDSVFSTYQLNQMQPLISYNAGLLDLASCVDRLHQFQLRDKAVLASAQKRTMHERALAMGLNDPLAPDYSHFFIKTEKRSSYRIIPLNNGLYVHLDYYLQNKRSDAAIKIQTVARLYLDKKLSERAARQMALQEAKTTAVKELKARILREYQKREGARGVGKMKWDAEVRMRQAKLRAAGQMVSRSDVVMLMVEEAITVANQALDQKFKELQLETDNKTLKLLQPKQMMLNLKFSPDLFDIRDESSSSIRILEGAAEPDPAAMGAIVDGDSVKAGSDEGIKAGVRESNPETNDDEWAMMSNDPVPQSTANEAVIMDIVRGKSVVPLLGEVVNSGSVKDPDNSAESTDKTYGRGETAFESQLRRIFALSEGRQSSHLYRRLRLLDKVMTEFKANEILSEMPSKRLLLKYVSTNELGFLQEDLRSHFKLKKYHKRVAQYLRNMERTDSEFGVLRRHAVVVQAHLERGLLLSHQQILLKGIAQFREAIELRKDSNTDGKSLQDYVKEELLRVSSAASAHRQEYDSIISVLSLERSKAHRAFLSLEYCNRQLVTVKEYSQSRAMLYPSVPLTMRHDWNRRYYDCISAANASRIPMMAELSSLITEFLEIVRNDACMIVNDLYQPDHNRNIPIHHRKDVNGRAQHCGRGIHNHKAWYFAHNIFYRVALDYDGVYNGSDENAAKAASTERLASREYINAGVDRLHAPLTATVDYFGYRVLAVAMLPIQHIVYDDSGEVQRVSEDFVHGMNGQGDYFVNRSKLADKLLKMAAAKLNVAEHHVKGLRDLSTTVTFASGLLKVYRGADDKFYLRNCASVLPCEPSTGHLFDAPRTQSIFWRRLRPEFVKTAMKPLSSDAFTLLTNSTADAAQHSQVHNEVMDLYLNRTIPDFVRLLLTRQYHLPLSEGLGINLGEELHQQGINIRHLGYMRGLIWRALPGTVSVYNGEKFIRSTHNLSVEVENGEEVVIKGLTFKIEETRRNRITTSALPISHKHKVDSINNSEAHCGRIRNSNSCDEVRLVLLGEMVARCLKNCIRFQLRSYNEMNKSCSHQFLRSIIAEHLNFLTGAGNSAAVYFEEVIYDAIRERFGKTAIRVSERKDLLNNLKPILLFIIHRTVDMCGVRLASATLSALSIDPVAFTFCSHDIIDLVPIVRHNACAFSFAEAMLLAQEADKQKLRMYSTEVLLDLPTVFFNLSERKGGRISINYGRLGTKFNATVGMGCELEQTGPIKADRFVRAVSFHPMQKSCIDCNHHEAIVSPSTSAQFSVELFFRCLGGRDTPRTLIDNGRYRLGVGRDNNLFFALYEGVHTINLKCCAVNHNGWYHVVSTFDGTFLKCFVNTDLKFEIEVQPIIAQKDAVLLLKHNDKLQTIAKDEIEERTKLKEKTVRDAALFFQTKEGLAALKRISQRLIESDGFNPELHNESDEPLTGKQKRAITIRKAKDEHIEEMFEANKTDLSARFVQLVEDEQMQFRKFIQNGRLKVYNPFRIGASLPDASNRDGCDYFLGHISCVSVFDKCLSADRIHAHYFASQRQTIVDTQRLHARATAKFAKAFTSGYSPGLFDSEFEGELLSTYAKSLCSFLYLDPEVRNKSDVEASKAQLVNLLAVLKAKQQSDVIASLVKAIPRDPEFADIVVESLLCLQQIDRHYLSTSLILPRDFLVFLPFELALIAPYRPYRYYEAAAFVFQEVVRDHEFSFAYGEVELDWLTELSSPLLVISVVKNAFEDRQLKTVRIIELMSTESMLGHAGLPSDSDVQVCMYRNASPLSDVCTVLQVLVQNSPLLEGFDFGNCSALTNSALEYLNRINSIRSLDLTRCSLISDQGLLRMHYALPRLERLSLEDLSLLTDAGLQVIALHCSKIAHLNINGCHLITVVPVLQIARANRFLTHLHLSKLLLTDDGLVDLSSVLQAQRSNLIELDLSHCSAITDIGIAAIADACSSIRVLRLAGLHRVSFRSVQLLTTRCWDLQLLDLQDVFLTSDKAMIYEAACDGRAAANERMLVAMKSLTLTDCLALTDRGMRGLAERCRELEMLKLKGCSKLTDLSLTHFADETLCSLSKFALAATLVSLDLSYCTLLTARGLQSLLCKCQSLHELNLSGLVNTVDDQCVRMIGHSCSTIQTLRLRQCLQLTDLAVCHIAEALWIEDLDLSGCHRISDRGVEVLAEAFSGLQCLQINKLKNVTTQAIRFLQQSCRALRRLDCEECPLVSFQDIDLSQWNFTIHR